MKTALLFIFLLTTASMVEAQTTIRKNTSAPNRWRVERDGKAAGEIKRDYLFRDRFIVYDRNGKRVGTIRSDYLFKERGRATKKW